MITLHSYLFPLICIIVFYVLTKFYSNSNVSMTLLHFELLYILIYFHHCESSKYNKPVFIKVFQQQLLISFPVANPCSLVDLFSFVNVRHIGVSLCPFTHSLLNTVVETVFVLLKLNYILIFCVSLYLTPYDFPGLYYICNCTGWWTQGENIFIKKISVAMYYSVYNTCCKRFLNIDSHDTVVVFGNKFSLLCISFSSIIVLFLYSCAYLLL